MALFVLFDRRTCRARPGACPAGPLRRSPRPFPTPSADTEPTSTALTDSAEPSLPSPSTASHTSREPRTTHGRRQLLHLAKGTLTRDAYDPGSHKLHRHRTDTGNQAKRITCDPSSPIHDHTFRYDLADNILTLADRTPGCGIPLADPNSLDRQFSYDGRDRMLTGTGEADRAPGRAIRLPPPMREATVAVWCGSTNGGRRVAGIILPAPGGPISNR